MKRSEFKLGRLIEIFTVKDGFVRSARVKMAHGELNRPVVKLAPVFYDGCFGNRKQGRRCRRHLKSATKATRQQELTVKTKKT